jgi:hypothetical protein
MEQLQAMVPPEIFQNSKSVHTIMDATDYIVEHNMKVNARFLNDLRFTIRVRKRVAQFQYDGGDQGHAHFITVLEYCWRVLKPQLLRKKTKKPTIVLPLPPPIQTVVDETSLPNRFSVLTADDETDVDEDEVDEKMMMTTTHTINQQ